MIEICKFDIDYLKGHVCLHYKLDNNLDYLLEFVTVHNDTSYEFNMRDLCKLDHFIKNNYLYEIHIYSTNIKDDYLSLIGVNSNGDKQLMFSINCQILAYGVVKK
jgi:hypothetical protein